MDRHPIPRRRLIRQFSHRRQQFVGPHSRFNRRVVAVDIYQQVGGPVVRESSP